MSGGGSDSKVRSKISRGSSDNETEWITDMDSGGANEDWCRNEGPRPSTLALRGLKGFATQLNSRHHVAERALTLPVPHALNRRSTTPRGLFFCRRTGELRLRVNIAIEAPTRLYRGDPASSVATLAFR